MIWQWIIIKYFVVCRGRGHEEINDKNQDYTYELQRLHVFSASSKLLLSLNNPIGSWEGEPGVTLTISPVS